MARSDFNLVLEPATELKFTGPFTEVVLSTLKLSNPTEKSICFKIKTTAPRRYCVRPNSGIVQSNQDIQVAVMLQPFEYDPNEKNKHKFMVQTITVPEGDFNLETLFKEADSTQLMDYKLRCVFEMPVDQEAAHNVAAAISVPHEQKDGAPKSSPKQPATLDNEMRKAGDEIKKLREEASSLRQENLVLKEDVLRLRNTSASAERKPMSGLPPTLMAAHQQAETPFSQYAIMVAIAILGFIIGKFLL